MIQATNYCSTGNRLAKAKTQRWEVIAVYADPRRNTRYLYRTAHGAKQQLAYLERMIASNAMRNLGSEVPMISASIIQVGV